MLILNLPFALSTSFNRIVKILSAEKLLASPVQMRIDKRSTGISVNEKWRSDEKEEHRVCRERAFYRACEIKSPRIAPRSVSVAFNFSIRFSKMGLSTKKITARVQLNRSGGR